MLKTSFKANRLRARHINDKEEDYKENPHKIQIDFVFNGLVFDMKIINLIERTYFAVNQVEITISDGKVIIGQNEQYRVELQVDKSAGLINKVNLRENNNQIILEYVFEKEQPIKIEGRVRNKYVINAIKRGENYAAQAEDGFFSIMEVDFAFMKIRQKLDKIKYDDFLVKSNGSLKISVIFCVDPINTIVEIQNDGFDYDDIVSVVDQVYNSIPNNQK